MNIVTVFGAFTGMIRLSTAWFFKNVVLCRMKSIKRKKEKTLLASWMLNIFSPFAMGYAAYTGRSILLWADFLRRISDLLGLFFSWHTTRSINQNPSIGKKRTQKYEKRVGFIVGCMLFISSLAIGATAINRLLHPTLPTRIEWGIAIAASGVLVNGFFTIRYRKMQKAKPGPVLYSQVRLYGAKTRADLTVVVALLGTLYAPDPVNLLIDPIGSVIISLLMLYSGIKLLVQMKTKAAYSSS